MNDLSKPRIFPRSFSARDVKEFHWLRACLVALQHLLKEHIREPYQTTEYAVAWDTFKKQFMKKFVPKHITDDKQIKFGQQGGTIHKFTRLSKFTEDLIDTEEKKIKRFPRGLRPGIHKDVTTVTRPQTYDDAIKRTY